MGDLMKDFLLRENTKEASKFLKFLLILKQNPVEPLNHNIQFESQVEL